MQVFTDSKKEEQFDVLIGSLILLYKDECLHDRNEPFDGDMVEELAKLIWAKIDLNEGNVTPEEYKVLIREALK